jgi:hypothetical protein
VPLLAVERAFHGNSASTTASSAGGSVSMGTAWSCGCSDLLGSGFNSKQWHTLRGFYLPKVALSN